MKKLICAFVLFNCLTAVSLLSADDKNNRKTKIDEQVATLLAKMTLEEKSAK